MIDNIRVVLSHTTHPGNIGAAARAMKTMGLRHLYLISQRAEALWVPMFSYDRFLFFTGYANQTNRPGAL